MNILMMPPAYCLSNVEIVDSFLYVFQSSVLLCSVRARPLKKLCLLVWLKTDLLKFIDLWKPGLAESIYNYRPCSRWGPAHHPSTKGSPCFCTKMRPSMLGRKGILNDASNLHVMSKPTQVPIYYSTNKYAIPPIAKHKGKRTVGRLGAMTIE